MKNYTHISPYRGFDSEDLDNGRQNNYAWSMCEFGDYIYVGTGRNLISSLATSMFPDLKVAIDFMSTNKDMAAEIWRYKKDGSLPMERVYKAPEATDKEPTIYGFRYLQKFKSLGVKPVMYASGMCKDGIKILKSTNGVNWFEVPNKLGKGLSCRSMLQYKNKLYMGVINNSSKLNSPSLLYSSYDPELFGWKLESSTEIFGKNPIGNIWSMAEFNGHLYVGTESKEGFMIWRTDGEEPEINKWVLVVDKGAGDATNECPISMEVFNNHLYIGTATDPTKLIPFVVPKGADLIRVNTADKWEVVVGGTPLRPTYPTTGMRGTALSGLSSGFNDPYNFYIWQLKVYNNRLYVGTFNAAVCVEPIIEMAIKNKHLFNSILEKYPIGESFEEVQKRIKANLSRFMSHKKSFGCDLYSTMNGVSFAPITQNGFGNHYDYGIRSMVVTKENALFVGTANPFEGCTILKFGGYTRGC